MKNLEQGHSSGRTGWGASSVRLSHLAIGVMVAVAVLVAWYWVMLSAWHDRLRQDTLAQAEKRASQLATLEVQQMESLLLAIDLALRHYRDSVLAGDPKAAESAAHTWLATFPAGSLAHFSTISADGHIINTTLDRTRADRIYVGDREYFRTLRDGGKDQLFIAQPMIMRTSGAWRILLSRPLLAEGRFDGVVVVSLDPKFLADGLARLEMGRGDVVTLSLDDGTYLARSVGLADVLGKKLPPDRPFMRNRDVRKGVFRAAGNADAVQRIFAWERLALYPLLVNVGLDEAQVLAPVEAEISNARKSSALGTILVLGLSALVCGLLLVSARGQAALAKNEALLRSTLESTEFGILVVDSKGAVIDTNRRFHDMWAIPVDLPDHDRDRALLASVQSQLSDPDGFLRTVAEIYGTDAVVSDRLLFKDGRVFERFSRSFSHGGGKARLWAFRDITDSHHFERRLLEATEALQRSNAELEQFAYVASHDLREPLRMVSNYMTLLERSLGKDLSQDQRDFIGFARDGAIRMDRLMLDLLEFSRIGRGDGAMGPVNLGDVARRGAENLALIAGEHGARITIDEPMPTVTGIEDDLVRLFQNLIGNAIKYREPGRTPVITISARRDGDEWTVSVTDNGIGIETEYFDQIFGLFQRLHGRDEYDGTGIGLANCRKIAEYHGGRIWVESVPGQGSCFHFSLPAL